MEPDRTMEGFPPPPEARVTLANWDSAPFNRWSFRNIRSVLPTAEVWRGDGAPCPLPRAESDIGTISFTDPEGRPRTLDEVLDAFSNATITAAPVNEFADAANDEHVLERGMIQRTTINDGSEVPLVGPVAKFSRTPVKIRFPAQPLGAQNQQVLDLLGIDPEERARLVSHGVIGRYSGVN